MIGQADGRQQPSPPPDVRRLRDPGPCSACSPASRGRRPARRRRRTRCRRTHLSIDGHRDGAGAARRRAAAARARASAKAPGFRLNQRPSALRDTPRSSSFTRLVRRASATHNPRARSRWSSCRAPDSKATAPRSDREGSRPPPIEIGSALPSGPCRVARVAQTHPLAGDVQSAGTGRGRRCPTAAYQPQAFLERVEAFSAAPSR